MRVARGGCVRKNILWKPENARALYLEKVFSGVEFTRQDRRILSSAELCKQNVESWQHGEWKTTRQRLKLFLEAYPLRFWSSKTKIVGPWRPSTRLSFKKVSPSTRKKKTSLITRERTAIQDFFSLSNGTSYESLWVNCLNGVIARAVTRVPIHQPTPEHDWSWWESSNARLTCARIITICSPHPYDAIDHREGRSLSSIHADVILRTGKRSGSTYNIPRRWYAETGALVKPREMSLYGLQKF